MITVYGDFNSKYDKIFVKYQNKIIELFLNEMKEINISLIDKLDDSLLKLNNELYFSLFGIHYIFRKYNEQFLIIKLKNIYIYIKCKNGNVSISHTILKIADFEIKKLIYIKLQENILYLL